MSSTITGTLTSTGRVNTPPATLYADIFASASTIAPAGLTLLPGGLVEDVCGTGTGAAVVIDQFGTETLNSISPYSANPWLLTLHGQVYMGQGSTAFSASNTAVFVVFTGTVGFVISPGFVVGDGTNQYAVTDGGIILTGGSSLPLFAVALTAGSFAVPAGTVTTLVTSAPSGVTLTVTNPSAGTPGGPAQTEGQYRAQVLQAGLSNATGMTVMLRNLLGQVPGVQSNLIAIRQVTGPKWEVIVGGTGDPYAIGNAIFQALFDVNTLTGSTLGVVSITNANPGVVTTNLNHGYTTGQVAQINGTTGISGINGVNFTVTVVTPTSFQIGINTTSSGAYGTGGVVTPNFRNTSVTINDYPDSYTIPIVIPPVQTVSVMVEWNTLPGSNFVSALGVASLASPAIAAYINAVFVGAPISVLLLNDTFEAAVASILPSAIIDVLTFAVTINGVATAPEAGTQTIFGDPESYFLCAAASVVVNQSA